MHRTQSVHLADKRKKLFNILIMEGEIFDEMLRRWNTVSAIDMISIGLEGLYSTSSGNSGILWLNKADIKSILGIINVRALKYVDLNMVYHMHRYLRRHINEGSWMPPLIFLSSGRGRCDGKLMRSDHQSSPNVMPQVSFSKF